jgi:hypothetical protein
MRRLLFLCVPEPKTSACRKATLLKKSHQSVTDGSNLWWRVAATSFFAVLELPLAPGFRVVIHVLCRFWILVIDERHSKESMSGGHSLPQGEKNESLRATSARRRIPFAPHPR